MGNINKSKIDSTVNGSNSKSNTNNSAIYPTNSMLFKNETNVHGSLCHPLIHYHPENSQTLEAIVEKTVTPVQYDAICEKKSSETQKVNDSSKEGH